MDDDFLSYLERLEMMAFFSAYPLIYALIYVVAGNSKKELFQKIPALLPYAYALVGTLYLGLQLKNRYPDYSFENISGSVQQPILIIWAILSFLFWIPAFSKRPVLSLIHSLVFFFFLLRDLFLQISVPSTDKQIVRTDMKIYTDSLLLNLGALAVLTIIYFLIRYIQNKKSS